MAHHPRAERSRGDGYRGARPALLPAHRKPVAHLPNLEADGLISRRANKQDQRRVGVSLTAKGRRLFETVAPQSEAIYARLAQEIGPQRLEQIYGLLDEVIGILETPRRAVKSVAARSRVAVRRGKAG